jgi:hypothetical protein
VSETSEREAAQRENIRKYAWKPGQSGNPKGRPPREHTLTTLLVDELKRIPGEVDGKPNEKTWEQLLAEALPPCALKCLKRGDIRAFAFIVERVEGRTPERVDITSGGDPVGRDIKVPPRTLRDAVAIVAAARAPGSPN